MCHQSVKKCNGDFCQNVCLKYANDTSMKFIQQNRAYIDYYERIDRVPLIGTHNSWISNAYGIGVEELDASRILRLSGLFPNAAASSSLQGVGRGNDRVVIANQRLSVTDQLVLGLRHLELDIHSDRFGNTSDISVCHWPIAPLNFVLYVEIAQLKLLVDSVFECLQEQLSFQDDRLDIGDALGPAINLFQLISYNTFENIQERISLEDIYEIRQNIESLCNTTSRYKWLEWNKSNLGCQSTLYRLSMRDALLEVHTFLQQYPEEFVIIYLDSRVPQSKFLLFQQTVLSVYPQGTIFTPRDWRASYNATFPSMRQLIDAGYRVMFELYDRNGWFKSRRHGQQARDFIFNRNDLWQEFKIPQFDHQLCTVNGHSIKDGTTGWRALDTSLSLGPSILFNTSEPTVDPKDRALLRDCNVQRLALDQFVPWS
ncbi:hypothetical protein MIR68_003976 [Amoeboaphelidium protococcarum]|nr:hypothetical protein MIR68_003976 [Amoeboaphelidium protococcarum]